MRPIRLALAAVLAGLALQALGQHALEIIALKYRTADQVLPVLRPLLEPGGTLTGQQNQLIVRASPANLAELRRALDTIDRPLARLQILVRFDDAADAASQGVEASGRIGSRGSRIDVRAHDRRTLADERVDQRVQVLEGGRALIAMGQSTPLPYAGIHETATGFEVVPRVSGQTVFLDIAQQRETPAQQQRLATTVSARLGEWFELAGVRGIAQSRGARSAESRRIWVKVEEIGN
jgi:type II secretory pathway component GspD/PulD (secretin)